MKKIIAIVILLPALLSTSKVLGQSMENLRKRISEEIASVDGIFGIAFRSLDNRQYKLFINEQVEFHAASTMKTPVMIEVFKQAANGKFSLDDSIEIKNEFTSIVDGGKFRMEIDRDEGEGFYKYIGRKAPIILTVENMITLSGNLATNNLIELVGAKNVTHTMRELGANKIKVLRGVEDMKAYEKGLSNTTTPYDLMLIFEAIAKRKIVNEEACERMIDILLRQKFNSLIPKYLPDSVKVAHKTGSITGVRHDSGIVYLPAGRAYLLIILSKELEDEEAGEEVIASISKYIYDFIAGEK